MPVPNSQRDPVGVTKGASFTVTEEDHSKTFYGDTTDLVMTLPAVGVTNAGMRVTLVNRALSSGTGFSASPAAADNIDGGTDNKDLINSGATDVLGDQITLTSNGLTGWDSSNRQGVWAAEA